MKIYENLPSLEQVGETLNNIGKQIKSYYQFIIIFYQIKFDNIFLKGSLKYKYG